MTDRKHRAPLPRTCLKVEAWPDDDRRLWAAALQAGDGLFDDGGTRAERRPLSNLTVAKGYGRWLTFLTEEGDLDPAMAPADRITPDRLRAYVARLQDLGNAPYTVLNRLHELHAVALVMGPDRDWSFLTRLMARLRARRQPKKSKRDRMVTADALLGLGLDLMAGAATTGTPRQQAVVYRDGLIIALLALQPLRLANLTGLVLNDTLRRVDGTWVILFGGEAVKTGVPIEVP